MDFLEAISDASVWDLIDIAVAAAVIYALIHGIRRSRSGFVLTGLIMVSSFYVVARLLGLNLVTFVFQAFFTVILVALIVIFQDELRLLFERVALRGLRRRRGGELARGPAHELAEVLVRTLSDLARDRIGMILVLQGWDSVLRHVRGGVALDAKPSEALLKSLFDPHSIGHDGAVILSGGRIVQFSCHLPLSTDAHQLGSRGTRHAAALGLAERSDALCLVVSEERGTISVAREGTIEVVRDAEKLAQVVEGFLAGSGMRFKKRSWFDLITRNAVEKVAALIIAGLAWFFFVHESAVVYRSFVSSMDHAGLPAGLVVESAQPQSVQVILSGSRRSFYFLDDDKVVITAKLFQARAGVQEVSLTAPDVSFPAGLSFVNIIPRTVRFTIAATAAGDGEQPPK